jgi:class 3 adenylate cyclase
MVFDLEPYAAVGLYEPEAADAAERAELLEYLADVGCSIDEMLVAHSRGRLFALAGDRVIRPDRDRYTLAEVAGQLGADEDVVRRLWRACGLVESSPDDAVASPADVEAVATMVANVGFLGEDVVLGICRVMGSSLARISDALSGATRGRVTSIAVATSGSEIVTARAWGGIAQIIPKIGSALDVLFRHHLEAARMHFEQSDSYEVAAEGGINVGIGFADLSGFTNLTQRMTLVELSQLLAGFEQVAMEVVADHGGRVVKLIGDAVMYVTSEPGRTITVADGLMRAARDGGFVGRVGVSAGTTLALDGDYFGPVVNQAARLVAIAEPGEILATAGLVARMGAPERAQPLGPRLLRGFDEPVEIYRFAVLD